MNLSLLLAPLTIPLSWAYDAVTTVRNLLFDRGVLPSERFPLPVIGVGNLAVGGTGKTPHVEHILHLLHEQGLRPAMLSRGYGRTTRGFRAVEEGETGATCGDEPFQVSRNCPFAHVAVCEDRREGIRRLLACWQDTDVVVLDDAFQHRYVCPGLQILLTDAARPFTKDHVMPWGRLRESRRGAKRADVIVVTKCRDGQTPHVPLAPGQHLFFSRIVYAPLRPFLVESAENVETKGKRVLLISGIANPRPLAEHLRRTGAKKVEQLDFPDHHRFTSQDAARMARAGKEAELIVTTEKDAVRLNVVAQELPSDILQKIYVQPITVSMAPAEGEAQTFQQIIQDYVTANQRNR